jgi:hypothetical protein
MEGHLKHKKCSIEIIDLQSSKLNILRMGTFNGEMLNLGFHSKYLLMQ